MAVAAVALPGAAAAQDAAEVNLDMEEMVIFVGGIKDPANVEFVEDPADKSLPELPVVYEDEPAAEPAVDDRPDPSAGTDAGISSSAT